MFWGIYRVDLFSLVPIARERVLEAMETGVIVVNEAGRVVDLNPACRRMFSIKAGVGALLKGHIP
jgi:PAS domain-containing protein